MKKHVAIITTVLSIGTGGFLLAQAATNSAPSLEERVIALEARVQMLEGKLNTLAPEAGATRPKEVQVTPAAKKLDTPPPEVGATGPKEVKAAAEAKRQEPPPPAAETSVKWQNLELWRGKLSKGMSKDEVIALLGKPDRVITYGRAGERWWYGAASGGTVDLDADGRVNAWLEPHPNQ